MWTLKLSVAALLGGLASLPLAAQGRIEITAEPVECLPLGDNGIGWAKVDNNQPDTQTRLYFRRLNDSVEDLYWVPMKPAGNGRYWGIFPKAEDNALKRYDIVEHRENLKRENSWAEWWRVKDASDDRNPNRDLDQDLIRERASQGKLEKRDWLAEMDDDQFQKWLEQLENEPAEYFTAVHDFKGQRLAQSPTMAAEVRKNCRVELTPEQRGLADNLVVGETAYWQRDQNVFHWLCEGVVSRVDPNNVVRGDSLCRACVVAWWKKPALLIPGALAAGGIAGVVLIDRDPPPPASPVNP